MSPIYLVITLTSTVASLAMTTVALTVVIRAERSDMVPILDMLIRVVNRRDRTSPILPTTAPLHSPAGQACEPVEHLPQARQVWIRGIGQPHR
ncbi:hypothetical protein [Nocardia sp. NPDC023988]|uniref:hypothetical protein n=1 Tax=unclassified Nocardia TaxID=2637762 RepID=UPI0033DA5FD7